jgi:uncharacterized membrane protein (UPF0127 family)
MRFLALFFVLMLSQSAFAQTIQFGNCDLTIETAHGPVRYDAEFAATPRQTSRGLMFRETMVPRTGMFFEFGEERIVNMWMKNTILSLDMIFVDAMGKISHIHRGAVPQSTNIISSTVPARYVLELNAGEADADGLAIGQIVQAKCNQAD